MYYRVCIVVVFLLSLVLPQTTLAASSKSAGTKLTFENYQITAPFNVSLPVMSVDLVKSAEYSANELVIIGSDEQQQTWLAVYALDKSANDFILLDKLKLAAKYFAFDMGDKEKQLYFLSKNSVVSLQYNSQLKASAKEDSALFLQQKQSVNSIFLLNEASFITENDFVLDINDDGLDDIILPDFEQINIWLAQKNTADYVYQTLPISTKSELSRGGVNFRPKDLFYADFTLDGLQDIAWISQGSVNYFSQEAGKFSLTQNTITLNESIYGLDWWEIREADGESPDQSDLTHRAVEQIKDINGDGLVDVVVRFTQSSGVLDRKNDYEFYFGATNNAGQFEFPKTASTVIKAEGTLTGLNIIDVNNDQKFEVLLSSFELSISNIIGALLSGGIDQNVLLFGLNEENVYEEDAIINKEVELNFSLSSGQSGMPIVLLADVNGDQHKDLILSSDEEQLKIFQGRESAKLFNRKASKHKLVLPKNGALFKHFDINHDGKEDFVMRYGRLDGENMANKVTIVMVK